MTRAGDGTGRASSADETGRASSADEIGRPSSADETGRPSSADETGRPSSDRPTTANGPAKAHKRGRQQQLFDKHGRANWRDGKRVRNKRRRKPGRKPKRDRAGAPHTVRPELERGDAAHVVLRVVDAIGSLRKRHMYKALREASISVAKRELDCKRSIRSGGTVKELGAFRIVHVSIQRNHVHLLVEADDKMALSRGMQSFQISAAKHLNRAVSVKSVSLGALAAMSPAERRRAKQAQRKAMANRRRGTVFPDRFHLEIIDNPQQARHTLAYVLNNWRKHREDRGDPQRAWNVDPYSTGMLFDGWKEREDAVVLWRWPETYEPFVVYLPKTWLLREGWRKHGLITFRHVPSARKLELTREDIAA